MDPSKPPQDDPPPRSIDNGQNTTTAQPATASSHYDLSDSLNRLTLATAAATPLPASPSVLLSHDGSSRRSPPVLVATHAPTPKRTPSSSSLRDERRKSIPALQKRPSAASLRSVSQPAGPPSPVPSSRHSSSNYNFAGSSTTAASPTASRLLAPTEAHGPTAASVAAEYFQREVELHQIVDLKSKATVVVHDACYGHRFSRPRASKAVLASIVERPERIRACVLGISAAYIRLGRRHEGERFAPRPDLDLHLLPAPPFQIRKTSRSLPIQDSAVTDVHGNLWMTGLKSMCDVAESRLALTGKELVRPHVEGNKDTPAPGPELHSGDLYLCSESLDAFQGALGGVCDGIDAVFGPGPTSRAFVCIRPPGHHCSADFPSGFCWINNVHVGISYAAMNHGLTHAAILDFDLHHGDGSQDITWDHNSRALTAPRNAAPYKKTAIGYYSLHDINSYPCEGGDPDKVRNASVCVDGAHGQSIWNVHLETWETEAEFWKLYQTKYITLINKARQFLRSHTERVSQTHTPGAPPPKAAIFISAGFDASEWESPGMQRHKVNVPTEFYARFTADVVRMSQEEGLGVDGRVISVLEGGYSDRALTSGVFSHLAGLGDATASLDESADSRLALEMEGRLSLSAPSPHPHNHADQPHVPPEYDSQWWSPDFLNELEALVSPPIKREKSAPTFLASTKSFDAKVVPSTRDRRSFGAYTGISPSLPPLPEVDWATAAHELSRVLIPDDSRQTMSCRPEDLNAEASRQRRERQVALEGGINVAAIPAPPPPPEEKRQLRAIRKNRRRTVDGNGNDLPDASGELSPSVDASRRKSISTSTTGPIDMGDLTGSEDQANGVESSATATPVKTAGARNTNSVESSGTATPVRTTGARKPSGSRTGTPRRGASPRKAPPVPKVPTAYLPSKLSDEVMVPPNDVENLSAGLRRIKLVMPSPEEQAAREKAAEERKSTSKTTKNLKSPRSPRKTSGTRIARPKAAASVRSAAGPSSSPPPLPTPSLDLAPNDSVKQEKSDVPLASSPWESANETAESSGMDMSGQDLKPFGWAAPPAPASTFQHAHFDASSSPPFTPVITQPPELPNPQSNIYSPPLAAGQTKHGLPVFTSSSPIPFAAPDSQHPSQSQENPRPSSTLSGSQDGSLSHGFSQN
ncbi:uncharacterized protein N7482_001267 [Penicillium canariense]|uniref:Histone deacetylase domain-containing protein n=1 Tax=Penicillium canariense TaxID=189055 RepID=A0A9W9IGA3_9EURO|nr:uncharacterized protein N7482_001267 [Penicillium canariense]KAJ5175390.1 hypothetical protein N7482_001267 [Penicillium canariense]